MRALPIALFALVTCSALAACSTHRADLESNAPPPGRPPSNSADTVAIAFTLLQSQSTRTTLLRSEALAPLTEAACLIFKRTGSIRAYGLIRQLANALLAASTSRGRISGFFDRSTGSQSGARLAAISGLALAEAYAVTHEPRYRVAALAAAVDITNPRLGWVSSPRTVGVRRGGPRTEPNIALTANAALLLKRAAALGDPSLIAKSQAGLRTIYSFQAAVGRWYADVHGHLPMILSEWGTTLFDLIADGSKESLGIVGGGVPAIYENAFGARGEVLNNDQTMGQPKGVAIALRAIAAFEEKSLADKVFAYLVKLRRSDGTIALAASDDTVSQAYFAVAFAQRLASPTPSE